MRPDFSIIIVTYQRLDQLVEAVKSVLDQSISNYECLLFNDYPADNQKIEELIVGLQDPRFRFFPAERSNHGANYWRNAGVKKARGKYIAFLDDDDVWFTEKLAEHLVAHQQEDAFLVYSDYIKTWHNSSKKPLEKSNGVLTDDILSAIRKGQFSISTTSSVSLVNDIKGDLFDESLFSFQDWDAWFNLALVKSDAKFFRIKKPLLYFVQHGNSRTSTDFIKRSQALLQVFNKYQNKGIDVRGFFDKESLNLFILEQKRKKDTPYMMVSNMLFFLFQNPRMLQYKYTFKRIGRFFFKEEKV